jgi:hypothetical protein
MANAGEEWRNLTYAAKTSAVMATSSSGSASNGPRPGAPAYDSKAIVYSNVMGRLKHGEL